MSEMLIPQVATPAPTNTAVASDAAKSTEGLDLKKNTRGFSTVFKAHVANSGKERLLPEKEVKVNVAELVKQLELAVEGNALPLDLIEQLPPETLEQLPDDLLEKLQSQLDELSGFVVGSLPTLPNQEPRALNALLQANPAGGPSDRALANMPTHLPDAAGRQLADGESFTTTAQLVRQVLNESLGQGQQSGKSGFEQIAANLLQQQSQNPFQTDRPAMPDSAVAALTAVHGQSFAQQATAAQATPPAATQINVPFQQPGWDNALSERVVWMVNQKLQSAEIKLNPPQLGPIEVRLNLSGDHHNQAQVSFTAHHGAVRDALEQALPRLREMFQASGIDLVDVNVSDQSPDERPAQAFGNDSGSSDSHAAGLADLELELETEQAGGMIMLDSSTSRGVIDYFA